MGAAIRCPETGRFLSNGGIDPEARKRHAKTPKAKRTKWAAGLRRYGLTPEDYESMEAAQGGVCAICGGRDKSGRRLSVDHDHACCNEWTRSCGKCVRGLICVRCNVWLGVLENEEWIALAMNYLQTEHTNGESV